MMPKVNCPNCGRFCSWDEEKEEYTCSCGGMRTRKEPNHLFIEKISDPRVHERLSRDKHRKRST